MGLHTTKEMFHMWRTAPLLKLSMSHVDNRVSKPPRESHSQMSKLMLFAQKGFTHHKCNGSHGRAAAQLKLSLSHVKSVQGVTPPLNRRSEMRHNVSHNSHCMIGNQDYTIV